ncbi:MAG: phosphate ABC transporter permease PstA [Acidimicrobiia bacterium]|nr:phosphate ABC transporter permease PstA [Acidimicrobiia bacterium]
MTAVALRGSITESTAGRGRQVKSALATVLIVMSLVIVMIPLVMIIVTVVSRGWASVTAPGWFTADIPIVSRSEGPGMAPAVLGTLMITGVATAMAVPLGILGGIYLNEYSAGSRLGGIVRFFSDVMTGVPSIVMGLFVYTIWTLEFGFSAFGGALALAALMLPVVIRTSDEMLKLVPMELRESAYALGGRKAGTIVRVVLPAAAPGIISGALLAIARAAGETAPLLFTIGFVNASNSNLMNGPNTALSREIFKNAISLFPGQQARAWGAALTLIGIVFVFTILARIVSTVLARKHSS